MSSRILSILLTIYTIHALAKFGFFFIIGYRKRRALLDRAYAEKTSATKVPDIVLLALPVLIAGLLFASGIDYQSFLAGLLAGMTLIQVYFHRFSVPLGADVAPDPPNSPIKTMSYAIQAMPGRPWKELIVMALLLIWSLHGLAEQGGWFK